MNMTMYEKWSYVSDAIAYIKVGNTDKALEALYTLRDAMIKEEYGE